MRRLVEAVRAERAEWSRSFYKSSIAIVFTAIRQLPDRGPLGRVQRHNAFYLVFCSLALASCSSAFCQLESALYSFIALARTSVFLPRSF